MTTEEKLEAGELTASVQVTPIVVPPGKFYTWFRYTAPFDPECRYVTSTLVSPLVLAIMRSVMAGYMIVVTIVSIVWAGAVSHTISLYFSYFTDITYIGLAAYMLFACIHGFDYAKHGATRPYLLQRWPRFFQFCHQLLHATILGYPIIVTIVFWGILTRYADPFVPTFNGFDNISKHLLNTVFALTEITLSCAVPAYRLILPFLLGLILYLGIAYITYADQGVFVYPFLNPDHPVLLGVTIAMIAVGAVVVYSIVFWICRLRNWVLEVKQAKEIKRPVLVVKPEEAV